MREFEQALKRARTVNPPQPPLGQGESPHIERVQMDAANAGAGPRVSPVIAEHLARIAADVAPPTSGFTGFGPGSRLPLLEADFERFFAARGMGGRDGSGLKGSFRLLRTQLLAWMQDRGGRVLGVTSPGPSAGKSVTSLHLAFACARRTDQHVVLADFDFRRPSLANYLSARNFRSSLGYFRGECAIEDCLSRNESGNLEFLLTDRPTDMSAEYLSSQMMDEAMAILTRQGPDTILIADLPPIIGCDDTLAIMPKLDGVVLVVASGETKFDDMQAAAQRLPPEKLVSVVLNKAAGKPPTYGYE